MKRRVTASLTLVLIGTATLQGCGADDEPATRDVYRTRADCQPDWGDEPAKCEAATSGPHAGYFYGPLYSGAGRTGFTSSGVRSGSHAVSSTHVSRGGFGSSASAHGASS